MSLLCQPCSSGQKLLHTACKAQSSIAHDPMQSTVCSAMPASLATRKCELGQQHDRRRNIPCLGKVGDMHQPLLPTLEPLQLHKATKVQDVGDCTLVHCTFLWLVDQRSRRRAVAGRPISATISTPIPVSSSVSVAICLFWAVAAAPFAVPMSVMAVAAMMPLPVPVPVAVPIGAVSVLPRPPTLIVFRGDASIPVRTIGMACAGMLLGLLPFGKAFCNQLFIKLPGTLFAVLHCQARCTTELGC